MRKLLFFFTILPFFAISQDFEYNVLFDGIVDNREFFNEYATPQTIFGARGAAEIGVKIDEHRIRIGPSKLFEFGSEVSLNNAKLILYYQYLNKNNEFLIGSFARSEHLSYPLAMLTDTLLYYRPNVEGLYTQAKWNWGKQDIFVDWTSKQQDTITEQFTVGFSGEVFKGNIFVQNYFVLYHDALTKLQLSEEHIKDYIGGALQVGIRTNTTSSIKAYIKAGILNSNYRERSITDGFIIGNSFFAEAYGKYKFVGLKSTLSFGNGHIFAQGDRFYQANNYMRNDIIWYFIRHKNVTGVLNISLHIIDWKDLDQQQQLSIIYKFGGSIPIGTNSVSEI